jgi:hypothetical protein
LGALVDVALAQDDEPRIPVLAMVDAKFAAGELDGFRHDGMPPDPETWRRVAAHLDGLAERTSQEQLEIVGAFADGELDWPDLDSSTAWSVIMRGALAAFYSHPWAWNEIGFGGPAYPRGYARFGSPHLEGGDREAWEGAPAVDTDPVMDVQHRGLD